MIDQSEFFRKVHEGLNLLSGFSVDLLGEFHPGEPIFLEQRISRQEEWLDEIVNMNPMEKEFFQDHWIPIQPGESLWYVDPSDPDLPVFATFFFDLDPKGWHKVSIYPSLAELIIEVEDGKDYEYLSDKQSFGAMDVYSREWDRRDEMIFHGIMETPAVSAEEVFVDGKIPKKGMVNEPGMFILLKALPLAIGLFAPETDIALNSVRCDQHTEVYSAEFEKITKIRHFMILLRNQGQEHFPEFQFDLVDSAVSVWHNEKNELIVVGLKDHESNIIVRHVESLASNLSP